MNGNRSFLPLFITNFLGVANDNLLKTLASFTILTWVPDERLRAVLMGAAAASLVLPYVFFSPLADRLTVLLPKCQIVRWAKLAEIPIIALAVVGLLGQSISLTLAAIVLMGLQSALFSPAKYALIRDIGGVDRISTGMGGMEGVSFLAVLGGTVGAAFLADTDLKSAAAVLAGLAVCGVLASLGLHAEETRNRFIHSVNPIRFVRRAHRMSARYPGLRLVIRSLCLFWATAAMLQQGLIIYGKENLHLNSTQTGALLVLAAIGIVLGQVLAGFVDRKRPMLSLVPAFGLVAAVLLTLLFAVPLSPAGFGVGLALLAFDLGFFKLPLDAEIQRCVKGPRLNTILAYFNQISFFYMFLASAAYAGLGWWLGSAAFLAFLALVMAWTSLRFLFGNRTALTLAVKALLAPRYAVEADSLPPGRPLLVLPNHPALVDPMLVLTTYPCALLRPLVDATFFKSAFFARILKTVNAVEVPDLRARRTPGDVKRVHALQDIVLNALRSGESILLYPSGHIYTENREQIGTRQLAYNVCRDLPPHVTVIGLRTTGLWGSIWSRQGRTRSPSFVLTLLKGAALWPLSPFRPRRTVTIRCEDLTDRVRDWSRLTRLAFNEKLTAWYNA